LGLFDAFTGSSAKKAAAQNAALFQRNADTNTGIYRGAADRTSQLFQQGSANNAATATDAFGRGQDTYSDAFARNAGAAAGADTRATDAFTGNFNQNAGYLNDAAAGDRSLISDYSRDATGALDRGFAGASSAIGNQIDAYQPIADLGADYGRGRSAYEDAIGINGAEGNQRAVDNFHAGPGYNFAVDQATDAAARKAASLGIAGSGNTLDAIRGRAQGFADQEYGQHLSRLGAFVPQEYAATSAAANGRAAGYGALAGLNTNDAAARVGVANNATNAGIGVNDRLSSGQVANSNLFAGSMNDIANRRAAADTANSNALSSGLFDTSNRFAGALTDNQNRTTAGLAGTEAALTQGLTGTNDQAASANAASNNQVAQASMQGSQNFWNLLGNLGSTAASIYTGGATKKKA
jgi:hypothetical protein